MVQKIMRFVIGIVGILLGLGISAILKSLGIINLANQGWQGYAVELSFSLLIGIIFFLFSYKILSSSKKLMQIIENEIQKLPFYDIALGSVGLIVGLLIANLVSKPLDNFHIPSLRLIGQLIIYGVLGYLGMRIPTKKREDIQTAIGNSGIGRKTGKERTKTNRDSCPKILDTSVIIDGRIADICKTGFIEGPLVIPEFVLEELQHIADSSDGLKRNRGRRGLDILNKIQKEMYRKWILSFSS